jgi:hypothetical protein
MSLFGKKKEETRKDISKVVLDAVRELANEPAVQEIPVFEPIVQEPEKQEQTNQEQTNPGQMRQEPVCEKDWGNERSVLKMLDGKLLADRRLYARALYMHKTWCSTLFESIDSEPTLLMDPMEFMVVDLSMGGIGIICDQEILVGTILSFKLPLDKIVYDIKCEVVYCFNNSDKYRAGLKIVDRDKKFIRHLKIFVARLTLQSMLGIET